VVVVVVVVAVVVVVGGFYNQMIHSTLAQGHDSGEEQGSARSRPHVDIPCVMFFL